MRVRFRFRIIPANPAIGRSKAARLRHH